MISEYGLPVIFLQTQQQTDWPMFAATVAASLAAFLAIAVTLYIYRDSKKPNVIVYLHTDDPRVIFLTEKNIGGGSAYGVSVTFSPALSRYDSDNDAIDDPGLGGLQIAMLAPGDQRTSEVFPPRCNDDELPSTCKAKVHYSTKPPKKDGDLYKQARLRGIFDLDFGSFAGLYPTTAEQARIDALAGINESLEKIAKQRSERRQS